MTLTLPQLALAHVKINLGLWVGPKRGSYHELETCFYPVVGCHDVIELNPARGPATTLEQAGRTVPGADEDNLVVKACRLMADRLGLPPVHIHLLKVLPTGTGLGAGSADATATLRLLSQAAGLGLSPEDLSALAAELGSDTAFFAHTGPHMGRGRGEQLTPLPTGLSLKGYWVVIRIPEGVHIPTREAFAALPAVRHRPSLPMEKILSLPVAEWHRAGLTNDFEPGAVMGHPAIGAALEAHRRAGAVYAAMSGSGSAVFGLYVGPPTPGADAGWQPRLPGEDLIWQGPCQF